MNTNAIIRHYFTLCPEERFRLILAARARADDLDSDRLVRAGLKLTLSMPEHSPYSHSFEDRTEPYASV